MSSFRAFLKTDTRNAALTIIRIVGGLIILPHGLQKSLGLFNGIGFDSSVDVFTSAFGIPAALAVLVIVAENLGSIGLIFGFLTRLSAAGIALVMLGAIHLVHWQAGFFMNWDGIRPVEGYEFHLLMLGMMLPLVLFGGGMYSADGWLLAGRKPAVKAAVAKKPAPKKTVLKKKK